MDVYDMVTQRMRQRIADGRSIADVIYMELEPCDFMLGYFLGVDGLLTEEDYARRGTGILPDDIDLQGVDDARETIKAILDCIEEVTAR